MATFLSCTRALSSSSSPLCLIHGTLLWYWGTPLASPAARCLEQLNYYLIKTIRE